MRGALLLSQARTNLDARYDRRGSRAVRRPLRFGYIAAAGSQDAFRRCEVASAPYSTTRSGRSAAMPMARRSSLIDTKQVGPPKSAPDGLRLYQPDTINSLRTAGSGISIARLLQIPVIPSGVFLHQLDGRQRRCSSCAGTPRAGTARSCASTTLKSSLERAADSHHIPRAVFTRIGSAFVGSGTMVAEIDGTAASIDAFGTKALPSIDLFAMFEEHAVVPQPAKWSRAARCRCVWQSVRRSSP